MHAICGSQAFVDYPAGEQIRQRWKCLYFSNHREVYYIFYVCGFMLLFEWGVERKNYACTWPYGDWVWGFVKLYCSIKFRMLSFLIAQSSCRHFWHLICFWQCHFFTTENKKTCNAKIKKNCSKIFVGLFCDIAVFIWRVSLLFYGENCADV